MTSTTIEKDYQATLAFSAAPQAVFEALTTLPGLARWWTGAVTGSGEEGGELRFYFGDDVPTIMRVDVATAATLVQWTCVGYQHLPDWAGTTITFALSQSEGGGTDLAFRHRGLTPQLECFEMCRNGWDHFLPSLRSYTDTGEGNPWASEADLERRAARDDEGQGVVGHQDSRVPDRADIEREGTTSTQAPEDYTAVLTLTASPATVSALLASAAGVSRWWGPAEGDAAVGGTLVASFGAHGVNAVRVLEAGPSRVVWESVTAAGTIPTGHTREWLGTTMEFDILPAGTGTVLRFRHAGLTPQLQCWDDCFTAWSYFMASIQAAAETGTGTPFGA